MPGAFPLIAQGAFHFLAACPGFLYCPRYNSGRLCTGGMRWPRRQREAGSKIERGEEDRQGEGEAVTHFVILFPGNSCDSRGLRASRNSGTFCSLIHARPTAASLKEGFAGGPCSRTCSRGLAISGTQIAPRCLSRCIPWLPLRVKSGMQEALAPQPGPFRVCEHF
jgi:hypothetical protein